jgi:hypothetical protein
MGHRSAARRVAAKAAYSDSAASLGSFGFRLLQTLEPLIERSAVRPLEASELVGFILCHASLCVALSISTGAARDEKHGGNDTAKARLLYERGWR